MAKRYSTNQAAEKLGLSLMSMYRYIKAKKFPIPPMQLVGKIKVRLWSEADIERVRALLPKIQNGRKTRYSKLKKKKPAPKRSKQ